MCCPKLDLIPMCHFDNLDVFQGSVAHHRGLTAAVFIIMSLSHIYVLCKTSPVSPGFWIGRCKLHMLSISLVTFYLVLIQRISIRFQKAEGLALVSDECMVGDMMW